MTTTVGATVRIGGESRGAQTALRAMGSAADATRASVAGIGTAALAGAAGMITMGGAMRVFGIASRQASEAARAFIEQSDSAMASQRGLTAELASFRVALGEAALGGGAYEDVVAALTQTMRLLTGVLGGAGSSLQDFTRATVAAAIDGVAVLVDWIGRARLVFDSARVAIDGARAATETIAEAMAALVIVSGRVIDVIARQALGLFRLMEVAEAAAAVVGIQMPDAFVRARRSMNELTSNLDTNVDAQAIFVDVTDRANARIAAVSASASEAAQRYDDWSGATSDLRAQLESVSDSLRNGTIETTAYAGAARSAAGAAREQAAAVDEVKASLSGVDALTASLAAKEAAAIQTRKAADSQIIVDTQSMLARQAELEEAYRKERIDSEVAAAQEMINVRRAASASIITTVADEATSIALGQKSALESVKSVVGQMLVAQGTAYLLTGQTMTFLPGLQALGIGAKIGAGAMIAAGMLLQKSGGGGGASAGVASAGMVSTAPTAAPQSVQNVTSVNNFGVVGDARGAAKMIAEQIHTARLEGYL